MLGHRSTCLHASQSIGTTVPHVQHATSRCRSAAMRPIQLSLECSNSSSSTRHLTATHKHRNICRAGNATVSPSSSSGSSSTGIELRQTLLMQQLLDDQLAAVATPPDSHSGDTADRHEGDHSSSSSSSRKSSSNSKGSRGFATAASSSKNGSSSNTRARQQKQQQQQQQQQVAADDACPCCSSLRYKDCCQPFLNGAATPRSALELVSARITAAKTGNVAYLVSTTHPDSSLALGGARNMAGRAKRVCSNFKANKMEVVGIAHCPGDLPGSWVVLTILQANAGEFAGQKTPYMELVVRKNWTERTEGFERGIWADDAAAAGSSADGQQWMYLRSTNEFPQNGQADVLVQLIQRHCPEVLLNTDEQQQQQQGVAEREVCFAWGAPNLHKAGQIHSSGNRGSSSSSGWYVDLLGSAAEPLGSSSYRQQQQQRATVGGNEYKQTLRQHRMLVPPGVFVMDDYLEHKAQQ